MSLPEPTSSFFPAFSNLLFMKGKDPS
jgi:hypothetical protein